MRLWVSVALFSGRDEGNRAAAEPRQTRHYRLVFAKAAVAGQRREVFQNAPGIIQEMRSARMTRHLHLLPRRQPGVGVGHQSPGAGHELLDLPVDIHVGVFFGELFQLDDLACLQLGDGTFEFQVMHAPRASLWEAENGTGTG